MKKILVDAKQATEFMALGYNVECHVSIPEATVFMPRKKKQHPQIPKTAMIGLALKGNAPKNGKAMVIWAGIAKVFYKDPLTTVTRAHLDKYILSEGGYPSMFAMLVHQYKVLRVVKGS